MRRPVGVIITCILLGLAALMLLLNALGSFCAILLMGHLPATTAGPTPPPAMHDSASYPSRPMSWDRPTARSS